MKKNKYIQYIVQVFYFILIILFIYPIAIAEEKSVILDTYGLGWDEMPQYMYNYDYNLSEVKLTYKTNTNTVKGTLIGTNLKPNFTYQIKLLGKPECYYTQGGDSISNEMIGYLGRWWDLNKSGINKNINDNEYEAYKDIHCIIGYLVFDYFTIDSNRDIIKDFVCNSSYPVFWCNCTGAINNQDLTDGLCPLCVTGEPEAGRPSTGTLIMPEGDYNLRFILTEECFLQGWNWSSVLSNDSIEFTIFRPAVCGDVDGDGDITTSDAWLVLLNVTNPGDPRYQLTSTESVDCDGFEGITTNDAWLIYKNATNPENPRYFLNCYYDK